jgi:hypothetical protein
VVFNEALFFPGLTHSSPLPTFLRIPLSSIQSTTYAYYPDETHSSIRRVFTPRHAPHTKRHFCGYCGTQLSFWQEDRDDSELAEWLYVNLGSLETNSLELLETAGILSNFEDDIESSNPEGMDQNTQVTQYTTRESGSSWFEEIVEGTRLGRIKKRRGVRVSASGSTSIEWSITEYESDTEMDEGSSNTTGKRKAGEMVGEDD